MNQSLHPDWDIARSRYPIVLQAVLDYGRHVDEVGDETLDESNTPRTWRALSFSSTVWNPKCVLLMM